MLDRLLEEPGIAIEGVVGTSSGAMNAAVTAYGLNVGGNEGARAKLLELWRAISETARYSLLQPSWLDWSRSPGSLDHSPGYLFVDMLSRFFSHALNPVNHNPLQDVLRKVRARIADLERMRAVLESLVERCDAVRGRVTCPIIETLVS